MQRSVLTLGLELIISHQAARTVHSRILGQHVGVAIFDVRRVYESLEDALRVIQDSNLAKLSRRQVELL